MWKVDGWKIITDALVTAGPSIYHIKFEEPHVFIICSPFSKGYLVSV